MALNFPGLYLRKKTWWLCTRKDGKRVWISLQTGDPLEAIQRATQIREMPDFRSKIGIRKEMDDFMAEKHEMKQWSRATMRVHSSALREFGERCANNAVTAALVEAHYRALRARVKDSTALIHMRALRSFFNWMVAKGRCARSPMAGMKLVRVVQYARTLYCTKAERDLLIANAPNDDLLFLLLCGFHAGMRKNEIIECRVGWFDLAGGAVRVQNTETFRVKDREARFIPLSAPFTEFASRYVAGRQAGEFAVRPDVKQGRNIYRWDYERPFRAYTASQNLAWVSSHVMRHTFASLLVQSGVSIYKAAAWLGDGVEVVERHYAHLSPRDSDIGRML